MQKINIVVEVHQGIVEDPVAFLTEDSAGKHYESKVTDEERGFRKKNDNESWIEYAEAFLDYHTTGNVPYDPMDYEIHWYETDLLP